MRLPTQSAGKPVWASVCTHWTVTYPVPLPQSDCIQLGKLVWPHTAPGQNVDTVIALLHQLH